MVVHVMLINKISNSQLKIQNLVQYSQFAAPPSTTKVAKSFFFLFFWDLISEGSKQKYSNFILKKCLSELEY